MTKHSGGFGHHNRLHKTIHDHKGPKKSEGASGDQKRPEGTLREQERPKNSTNKRPDKTFRNHVIARASLPKTRNLLNIRRQE